MSNLYPAIQSLIEQVERSEEQQCRISVDIDELESLPFIDWLESQPVYPKVYWQSRDTREEVVALGSTKTFTALAPAYVVLSSNQRLWGGRSFDESGERNSRCFKSFFFLPQIELIRFDKTWSLSVNIGQNKQVVLATLKKLVVEFPLLRPINAHVESVSHTPTMPEWHHSVARVLDGIENNQFKKVVLARKSEVHLDHPITAAQLLKASYQQNLNSFHFLIALNPHHAFIGSTPERLYRRIGRELHTEALAGTIGRGANASQDMELANWLAQDKKNLNENQLVVDDILERLQPLTQAIDTEVDTRLVRLREVQHLKRSISCELKPMIYGAELLDALQPTAAVAGLPRFEAMQFIRENEPFARGWYAGSVGYVGSDQAEFCVAIRSALVLKESLQLFAGAGIVTGSESDKEWQELNRKMATLLSLISDRQSLGVAS